MDDVDRLRRELLGAVAAAGSREALEQVRVAALGRKGRITDLMKGLGGLAAEARKTAGATLNRLKDSFYDAEAAVHKQEAAQANAQRAEVLQLIVQVQRAAGVVRAQNGHIEDALAIIETLRTNLASQELRASYFASVQTYYGFYIELLMRLK